MRVREFMTQGVVTVRPDTAVHAIAALMVEKRISGVPVVDDGGRVIGIVSQGDLLHRAEVGTERRHKWWLRVFADPNTLAREFSKAHGLTAKDVMSKTVVAIGPDAEFREAADAMDKHGVKRLPVLDDGRLIGLFTRYDLVRALTKVDGQKSTRRLDDQAVYKDLNERIHNQSWLSGTLINVAVDNGVVQFTGFVHSTDQRHALRVLAEETDGVVRVEDQLKLGMPTQGGI